MTDLQSTLTDELDLTGPAPQEAIHHRATAGDRIRSVVKHVLLIIASLIMSVACLAVALLSVTGTAGPYSVSAAMFVFAIGYLIVFSNATALTLEPHGAIAGFASSFFGFVAQVVSSAIGTAAVALAGTSITAPAPTSGSSSRTSSS